MCLGTQECGLTEMGPDKERGIYRAKPSPLRTSYVYEGSLVREGLGQALWTVWLGPQGPRS